jgi:iron complex transport system permease protein
VSRPVFWLAAPAALIVICFVAVSVGAEPIPLASVWFALVGTGDDTVQLIVTSLRLPRVCLVALVGAGLAASGGALQGTLRNPLAEPYLLGVSGGAAIGAVSALLLFGAAASVLPLAAFIGATAAVGCVVIVARTAGGRADARVLLMAGVVVGAFANAVIMALLSGADPSGTRNALWWMMGSAEGAAWSDVLWLALYLASGFTLLKRRASEMDALALGEDTAASLGVNVDAATWRIFLLASLLAAATVAAVGLVGFAGLVVPHIARSLGMRRHRELLAASALIGAGLLVCADLVARVVAAPRELPLSAMTALAGVPYFLLLLRRLR